MLNKFTVVSLDYVASFFKDTSPPKLFFCANKIQFFALVQNSIRRNNVGQLRLG